MSGGAMVPIIAGALVLHECRGLRKRQNEVGERYIRFEELPADHPCGLRYEVTVIHPDRVMHTEGSVGAPSSRQEPEIVHRGNDELAAKRAYATYAKVLGGSVPSSFDPKPEPVGGGRDEGALRRALARIDDLEADRATAPKSPTVADVQKLLARIEDLEKLLPKK